MQVDFPDVPSGVRFWRDHHSMFEETMLRRPPAKRYTYPSFDWVSVFQSSDEFVVVRGAEYLLPFKIQDGVLDDLPQPTLVCVMVQPLTFGTLKVGAKIFLLSREESQEW